MSSTLASYGLTGGIASGKTYVANLFAELGAELIDTDLIAREIVQPGQVAWQEIVARFGSQVLQADQQLDRAALRKLIFADPSARQALEAITHPRIRQLAFSRAEQSQAPYSLLIVPLMAEAGRYPILRAVVVVDCLPATQRQRLIQRDGISSELAEQMLAAQADRATRLRIADHVVQNHHAAVDLRPIVKALDQRFRSD